MANTIRSKEEILQLFVDNTKGSISAQDLRDFVVSVMSPFTDSTTQTTFTNSGITETYSDGTVVNTTFTANSVIQAYGNPVNKTITTTFNADGSISEVIS